MVAPSSRFLYIYTVYSNSSIFFLIKLLGFCWLTNLRFENLHAKVDTFSEKKSSKARFHCISVNTLSKKKEAEIQQMKFLVFYYNNKQIFVFFSWCKETCWSFHPQSLWICYSCIAKWKTGEYSFNILPSHLEQKNYAQTMDSLSRWILTLCERQAK